MNVNGDDALELYFNGTKVDVFGDPDVDGTGQVWEYLDGWAYRLLATGPDDNTFEVDNWDYSGVDALSGETTNAAAAVPFPVGTYAATAAPTALPTPAPTSTFAPTPTVQLIISGVIDGPLAGGLPKAMELYALEDIDDLSAYGVDSANNGGGSGGVPVFFLSGNVSAGDYVYVASEEAGFETYFGFPPDFVDDVSFLGRSPRRSSRRCCSSTAMMPWSST